MLIEAAKRMRVVIDGQVCIDRNTLEGGQRFEGAGSPPMFISKILRPFPNCQPLIIAAYGSDYLQYLEGVDIYPKSPNIAETLVYENNSLSGRRTQRALNIDLALPVQFDEVINTELESADIVIVAPILPNHTPDRYAQIAAKTLNKNALKVLLPQGHFRRFEGEKVMPTKFEDAARVLPNVDVVIVSEEDYEDMPSLAKGWSDQNPGLISIVTLGEMGAIAFNNGMEIMVPTIPVPRSRIIDNVGCGDTFGAAFALEYRVGKNIERAMDVANKVAGQRLLYSANDIKIDLKAIYQMAFP